MTTETPERSKEEIEAECMDVLAAARTYVMKHAPYLSDMLFSLVPHICWSVPTIGVSKQHVLFINPHFVITQKSKPVRGDDSKIPPEQREFAIVGGLLMHELGHLMRDISRLDALVPDGLDPHETARRRRMVNVAFDMPINQDLIDAGWLLPEEGMFPDKFNFPVGLTGEQYYELLQQLPPEKMPQSFQVGAGDCGTCAGGDDDEGGGSDGDERAALRAVSHDIGRTPLERELVIKAAASALATQGNTRGLFSAGLLEALPKERGPSVVPWKTLLSQLLRHSTGQIVQGRQDFSMRRVSKRSFARGVVRPGMISYQPVIWLVEDSSGSMGLEQLMAGRSEAAAVFKQCGIQSAWFLDLDAAISEPPKLIRCQDLLSMGVRGRGGTDFRPAFELAMRTRPRPDLIIYFTDGDGIAPETAPPGIKVIWCIVPSYCARKPANWGHLIVMSDDPNIREPYESH